MRCSHLRKSFQSIILFVFTSGIITTTIESPKYLSGELFLQEVVADSIERGVIDSETTSPTLDSTGNLAQDAVSKQKDAVSKQKDAVSKQEDVESKQEDAVMPEYMQRAYKKRKEEWLFSQPSYVQKAILQERNLRIVFLRHFLFAHAWKWVLSIVVVGLLVWGGGLWILFNYGNGGKLVASFIEKINGVEKASVATTKWNGMEMKLWRLDTSFAKNSPIENMQAYHARYTLWPWNGMLGKMHAPYLYFRDSELEMMIVSEEEKSTSLEQNSSTFWGVSTIEADNMRFFWDPSSPATGGEFLIPKLRVELDKEDLWVANCGIASGRIGWLRNLSFGNGFMVSQLQEGGWNFVAKEVQVNGSHFADLDIIAKWDTKCEMKAQLDWTKIALPSIGRCQRVGLQMGSLEGEGEFTFDFNEVQGMRFQGELRPAPTDPVHWRDHPCLHSLALLSRDARLEQWVFVDGEMQITGDGFDWKIENAQLKTADQRVLRMNLFLEGRIDASEMLLWDVKSQDYDDQDQLRASLTNTGNPSEIANIFEQLNSSEKKEEVGLLISGDIEIEIPKHRFPEDVLLALQEQEIALVDEQVVVFYYSFEEVEQMEHLLLPLATSLSELDEQLRIQRREQNESVL